MLHQIRKMVQLAIGITRGLAPLSAIPTALDPKQDISIPMAPELGLFLDACIFQVPAARLHMRRPCACTHMHVWTSCGTTGSRAWLLCGSDSTCIS